MLRPTLDMPYPARINPAHTDIVPAYLAWLDEFGLTPDNASRRHVAACRFDLFTSRIYPDCPSPELLLTIAQFSAWFFLFDDAFADRTPADPGGLVTAIGGVYGLTEGVGCTEVAGPYGPAFADICRRFSTQLDPVRNLRFLHDMRIYFFSLCAQLCLHTASTPRPETFEVVRRYTGGAEPVFDLLEPVGLIDEREWRGPLVRRLTWHANNVANWTNDVFSSGVERARGVPAWTLPWVYQADGMSAEDAMALTVRRTNRETAAFRALAEDCAAELSPAAREYVDGLGCWLAGSLAWHLETGRYGGFRDEPQPA